jgi:hypothetical protein
MCLSTRRSPREGCTVSSLAACGQDVFYSGTSFASDYIQSTDNVPSSPRGRCAKVLLASAAWELPSLEHITTNTGGNGYVFTI